MYPYLKRCTDCVRTWIWILVGAAAIGACRSEYASLKPADLDMQCALRCRPPDSGAIYKVNADAGGRYLSGLLITRTISSDSIRMVFTTEMGLTFFDFGFGPVKGFTVHRIMPQLNQDPVIRTLRKDLSMLWMIGMQPSSHRGYRKGEADYHLFREGEDHYYYILEKNCGGLLRMERASSRKAVALATVSYLQAGQMDSASVRHLNTRFTIALKRLQDETN